MRDTEKYGDEAAYRSEAADADFERDADDKARRFKRGTFALMADLYGEAEKIKDNAHRDEAAVQNARLLAARELSKKYGQSARVKEDIMKMAMRVDS